MKIDDSMIRSYLSGKDDYKDHWLFNSILDNGEYTFDRPSDEYKEKIKEIYEKTYENLINFIPYNVELFSILFSEWKNLINDVNIILAVGCPSPYDAMVREHNGREFIIFDLIRFMSYEKDGDDILSLITGMITHEIAHVCIHANYPVIDNTYKDKLSYITFDEGFAHLLAFTNKINSYNFIPMIEAHYENSVRKLQMALSETNTFRQKEYLEESNCGAYWNKFAAISGKLYLATNMDRLHDIYKDGPSNMISNIQKILNIKLEI